MNAAWHGQPVPVSLQLLDRPPGPSSLPAHKPSNDFQSLNSTSPLMGCEAMVLHLSHRRCSPFGSQLGRKYIESTGPCLSPVRRSLASRTLQAFDPQQMLLRARWVARQKAGLTCVIGHNHRLDFEAILQANEQLLGPVSRDLALFYSRRGVHEALLEQRAGGLREVGNAVPGSLWLS